MGVNKTYGPNDMEQLVLFRVLNFFFIPKSYLFWSSSGKDTTHDKNPGRDVVHKTLALPKADDSPLT